MPFQAHPRLLTPSNDTILWRYMHFAAFVQLLETQTLWFSRADQFEDPLEGSFTDAELAHLRSIPDDPPGHPAGSVIDSHLRGTQMGRLSMHINCWRSGATESLAMWDLYGKGSGIVAVKTTVGLLKAELDKQPIHAHIAQVRYVDWASTPWDNNAVVMLTRKDLIYEHESEVRAMIWELNSSNLGVFPTPIGAKPFYQRNSSDPPFGVAVPVDTGQMITQVVVGPRELAWVSRLVRAVVARYGLSIPVTDSDRLKPRPLPSSLPGIIR